MIAHRQALPISAIAADVAAGLAKHPKSLPPKLFYDAEGSALFEEITGLPEYYLTRTERAILEQHADHIVSRAASGTDVVELGAGSASKTQIILAAMLRRMRRLQFFPVDISESALAAATSSLRARFATLAIKPIVTDYCHNMAALREVAGSKLVLYLGSSIGNFEPMEAGRLLRLLRSTMKAGDTLLLGTDMVKPESVLLPAYDDSQGVTARFNKNMLARINRELGGNFDLDQFRHIALWNAGCSRIEMHLESMREQTVLIESLNSSVRFSRGERVHTENSYKFTVPVIRGILQFGGFSLEYSWTDERGWFALHLARPC